MIKIKSNIQRGKTGYYRFFSKEYKDQFWFTPDFDSTNFDLGHINDWTPENSTWSQIKKDEGVK